ncbi:hypothetical protein ILYODFUR_029346 [Ilyodon furcidens]|uniref:Uncharacterized protein n=1 Tax=Ilyodon furcidens TaxID=33524 RepID=A0ABV0UZD8_9TELE
MWSVTLLHCQIYVNRTIQDMPSFPFPVTVKPWKGGYKITNTASLLKHPFYPERQWSLKFLTGLLTGMPPIPSKRSCREREKKTPLTPRCLQTSAFSTRL